MTFRTMKRKIYESYVQLGISQTKVLQQLKNALYFWTEKRKKQRKNNAQRT